MLIIDPLRWQNPVTTPPLTLLRQVQSGSVQPDGKMASSGLWALASAGKTSHPLYAALLQSLANKSPQDMYADQLRAIGQVRVCTLR